MRARGRILTPDFPDLGCHFASSCLQCHLAVCAESPEGEAEALQRILVFSARGYEGRSSGLPPLLPDRPARGRVRGPAVRPSTPEESAQRLGVSRAKWYRLRAAGAIPEHLLPHHGDRPAGAAAA